MRRIALCLGSAVLLTYYKDNPAQGRPGVIPPVLAERDPGGPGRGVGVPH